MLKEFTIEVNPEDVNEDKLKRYLSIGINRLSIGIQSFNENDLKFLGRAGDLKTNIKSLELALKYFDNISADIIAGLKFSDIRDNLSFLVDRGIKHISVYILTLYKHLALYRKISNFDFLKKVTEYKKDI